MKKIFISLFVISTAFLTSCSNEDDYAIASFIPLLYSEDFPDDDIDFNQTFDFEGWTNFSEAGSKLWIERAFQGDGYIQFSSFNSGDPSNIGWAITPAVNLDETENEVLTFESASNFVDNPDNKLEIFISTDYDGVDVLNATWEQLTATVADNTTNDYIYIPSGEIDLSSYTGNIHIGFKVTGNSTTLDGLFQVDKIRIFSKN